MYTNSQDSLHSEKDVNNLNFIEQKIEELREFFDKALKPKKPTIKNLERELLVDFFRQALKEQAEQVVAEERERMVKEIERIVILDAIMKFNSTPEVFEPFNVEKHNYANKMLNEMNVYIYNALITSVNDIISKYK